VDLAATFSAMPNGMPNATPLTALPDAWHWEMAPGLDFTAALSEDREHAFQCFALRSYDAGLVAAVLSFARAHEDVVLTPPDRPLGIAEGLAHPGFAFDTVVTFGPVLHRHQEQDPALHEAIRAVQPAYRCEFAGDESEQDASFLFSRAAGVPSTRLDREPHPFLKMRYKTDTRVLPERDFVSTDWLVKELRALEGRPDGFVEYENYRHEVRRAEWADGQWGLTGDATEAGWHRIDELLELVKTSLYGPNLAAGTTRFDG
jgi:hypothetical protein